MTSLQSGVPCPLCGQGLSIKLARSKKGRPSISMACPVSGQHFRGFIADRAYVARFVDQLEDKT